MDELEISGMRYISTRRAGKEYSYHPDYIGQLIRGGKVPGQKVGRSWYVDAYALTTYLKGEKLSVSNESHTPVVHLREISSTDSFEKKFQFVPDPPTISRTETHRDSKIEEIKIPVSITYKKYEEPRPSLSKLRYIADEGPLLPIVQKRSIHEYSPLTTPISQPTYLQQGEKNQSIAGRIFLLFGTGIIIFFISFFIATGTTADLAVGQEGLTTATISLDYTYLGSFVSFVKP